MPIVLKEFQRNICENIVERFSGVKQAYDELTAHDVSSWHKVRQTASTVMLQAPTGSGKTLLAIDVASRFSESERLLWFWFAPFSGVVDQTRKALREGAPRLSLFDVATDRKLDLVYNGGVFVTTWQSVATRNKEGRKARQSGDFGLSVDDLIFQAREVGMRIGCVVDEAHHGFQKAAEARKFFTDVMCPDYTLLMTATPNDRDAKAFSDSTGYKVGSPDEWASISRYDGVQAGLLKKGVKMARFIAKKDDEKRLISFEHTAMNQCAKMHRLIKSTLSDAGIDLTPLMLVQVPNGKVDQKKAMEYLIDKLRFSEESVKIHTADEPDADLISLANDPNIEVLLFKMAVALGFDAPRAWTLAALRGARDANFGVQVVGRLMRVHRKLQNRPNLPAFLEYGYVFLANDDAQEGLLSAGALINEMETRASQLGSQIVITCHGDDKQAQVVKNGENLQLFIQTDEHGDVLVENNESEEGGGGPDPDTLKSKSHQISLPFDNTDKNDQSKDAEKPSKKSKSLVDAFTSDAQTSYHYKRRPVGPETLMSEYLPDIHHDFEEELLSNIDFSTAVSDRERIRVGMKQENRDVFDASGDTVKQEDFWARLEPEALAEKAQQLIFRFEDIDHGRFPNMLLDRFKETLIKEGFEPPEDDEELEQQLDLVLVRNPKLIAEAYKKCRVQKVEIKKVHLPSEFISERPLSASPKNIYGIYPPDLNLDEKAIASQLDEEKQIEWWHRNPARKIDSVALYEWADGAGFFPDFVVKVKDREIGDGIALLEVKGPHIRGMDQKKAAAVHKVYGKTFMVGRNAPGKDKFSFFRFENDALYEDGSFETVRLRWA